MGVDATRAPLTLLYVEDDQVTRDTVASVLRRRFPDLTLVIAEDGARGLELFRQEGPDLVITDIKMPVMHGIEMARRAFALKPGTPVIVTSAHGDMEYFIQSIEIGVSRYVMKPIDVEKLFTAVEETLARLRLERELKEQQEAVLVLNQHLAARASELEIANRDLEAFSYTVSHDLRTPLTNINGYCQVILELFGGTLDPQCRQFIEVIFSETIAMNELIKTLLDFSRLSRKELVLTPTNLSHLVQIISTTLSLQEPERKFRLDIAPDILAHCDRSLMRVVLDNLLGNAFKYTANKEEALIQFGVEEREGERVYFVRDNGAGFDMSQAGRLFGPFQRLHPEHEFKGHGIGLATVQRIIQRHDGRVWAEGREGAGAAFYFTLPGHDLPMYCDLIPTQGAMDSETGK